MRSWVLKVTVVLACAAFAFSSVLLGARWHGLRDGVQAVQGSSWRTVWLRHGITEVYTDPSGIAGVPGADFGVEEVRTKRQIPVAGTGYVLTPWDAGGMLLGLGTYSSTARFRAPASGFYRVKCYGLGRGEKIFVAPGGRVILGRLLPFALADDLLLVAGAGVGAWMWARRAIGAPLRC